MTKREYVVSVDVGTTYLKCCIYDRSGAIRGKSRSKVPLEHPQPGWSEIDEEKLWSRFQSVVKQAIDDSEVPVEELACLGISTQRGTFITWNRQTRRPLHKLINWDDLRSADMCRKWNKGGKLKAVKTFGSFLHFFSRSNRFMSAKIIRFFPTMAVTRLAWVLENVEGARELASEGNLLFGTIDTWLLWKISEGNIHVTDHSNASSTGLYDPYKLEWSKLVLSFFNIPITILPTVQDTSGEFCECPKTLFGSAFPVSAVVADQQSSVFGHRCWKSGDAKVTMGTGMFLDVNTGDKPHASLTGMFPLVGWKIGTEIVYIAEGQESGIGKTIEWGQTCGFYSSVEESSQIAQSVDNTGGVCFIPGFSGLLVPFNDSKACCGIIGITPDTRPAHLGRALLESVAYRIKQLYDTAIAETQLTTEKKIRMDGGVSCNDFVVQLACDLIGCEVECQRSQAMSNLGAAMLAGLATGLWTKHDLEDMVPVKDKFIPQKLTDSQEKAFTQWKQAVPRCLNWYN